MPSQEFEYSLAAMVSISEKIVPSTKPVMTRAEFDEMIIAHHSALTQHDAIMKAKVLGAIGSKRLELENRDVVFWGDVIKTINQLFESEEVA